MQLSEELQKIPSFTGISFKIPIIQIQSAKENLLVQFYKLLHLARDGSKKSCLLYVALTNVMKQFTKSSKYTDFFLEILN